MKLNNNSSSSSSSNMNCLTQYKQGNRSRRLINATIRLFKNNKVHTGHEENNATIDEVTVTLKQKLAGLSKTVKRYKDSNKKQCENKIFHKHTGKLY